MRPECTTRTLVRPTVAGVADDMTTHREFLLRADQEAHRDFDRVLTTMASGALAISLVFVHDVAPHPIDTAWLVIGWLLFTTTLVTNLISYLTSIAELRTDLKCIRLRKELPQRRNTTKYLNVGSAAAFCVGVVSLIIFATVNI